MIRKGILISYTLFITSVSLLPAESLPIPQTELFPHADKFVHFSIYAVFTFLMFYCWPEKFSGKIKQFLPLLIVLIWGTFMEILQGLGGYGRNFSYLDIIANSLGFLPGWLAWRWFGRTIPGGDRQN